MNFENEIESKSNDRGFKPVVEQEPELTEFELILMKMNIRLLGKGYR